MKALHLTLVLATFVLTQTTEAASWMTNRPMATARQHHTATLLPDGKVLVAGGDDGSFNPLSSAELYDPATGTWTNTRPMITARKDHTATLLPNGKVLVAGGGYDVNVQSFNGAELYDPAAGTWTNTGTMTIRRATHTATLLSNGKVLVAGGSTGNIFLSTAEVYDHVAGTWTSVTNLMSEARFFHTATLLPNGKLFVAGGGGGVIKSSADLYDPVLESWATTSSMNAARCFQTAVLLPNGLILVAGGGQILGNQNPLTSAELYDPVSGTSSFTNSMTVARQWQTATLLPSGKVLVAGGHNGTNALASSEVFDSVTGMWTALATSLNLARHSHTATLLPSGRVLIAGGHNDTNALSSTEVYDSASAAWTNAGAMNAVRADHSATLLSNGKVLVAGGYVGGAYATNGSELYDWVSRIWIQSGTMQHARYYHTATLLPNGKVLAAGGTTNIGSIAIASTLNTAELYDPVNGTWTNTGVLTVRRYGHTATLLPNGKVLVAGGRIGSASSNAEVYDPVPGTWTVTGAMATWRHFHTATLLPNGQVLVAGGYAGGGAAVSTAETFDPATAIWTATGDLTVARVYHTATLLPCGRVIVVGGFFYNGSYLYPTNAELYNPATRTWTPTGAVSIGRAQPTATLLSNGKVLMAGGLNGNVFSSVELFDSSKGTWTVTSELSTPRNGHTANLLPNGQVLVVGGYDGIGNLSDSAELCDVGLGFSNLWRPQIAPISSPINLGSSLRIIGAQFRGISGASGGNTQDSSTDYPLVQLRSIESGQTTFLLTTNWSTNSFTSLPVWNFPPGWALATAFVNGIPSTSSIVNITVPVPTSPTITNVTKLANGSIQFAFTNTVGAVFGALASTNLSLPLSNWSALSGVAEISPGQFQFTDPQATNSPQRFYRVRAN